MKDDYIDWALVRKRIDGSCTAEEGERLERWMRGDKERRRFVEHAFRYYEREVPVVDEARIERAWRQFARQRALRRRIRLLRFAGGVAASLLLLAVAAVATGAGGGRKDRAWKRKGEADFVVGAGGVFARRKNRQDDGWEGFFENRKGRDAVLSGHFG